MSTKTPMVGPGMYQWNKGGWIGAQVGCTAWMLVGAVLASFQSARVALVWFACFVLANAASIWLWTRRDRLRAVRGVQLQILVCGVCGLLALVAFDVFGQGVQLEVNWTDGGPGLAKATGMTRQGYLFFLIFVPLLILFLDLIDRGSRARAGSAPLSESRR
ncbi:hypothetical protein ACYOEI_29275 [Singulisphaera rosea]